MKEAKKGKCRKCGNYFYIHEHHILSQAIFGKGGKTIKLCPNCHTHFHEYSKKETKNKKNKDEAMEIWLIWLKTITVIASLLALVLAVDLYF